MDMIADVGVIGGRVIRSEDGQRRAATIQLHIESAGDQRGP